MVTLYMGIEHSEPRELKILSQIFMKPHKFWRDTTLASLNWYIFWNLHVWAVRVLEGNHDIQWRFRVSWNYGCEITGVGDGTHPHTCICLFIGILWNFPKTRKQSQLASPENTGLHPWEHRSALEQNFSPAVLCLPAVPIAPGVREDKSN